MELYEYLVRRGGRVTDRELVRELGMSKGAIYRAKQKLRAQGLISYTVSRERGGTAYNLGHGGARDKILTIDIDHIREREAHAHTREGTGELGAVKAAWAKYRGRVLIEDEIAEMAQWRAQLGEERLIELIAKAWRRCTADRMSFGYFADYYIAPELSGARKVGHKSGARLDPNTKKAPNSKKVINAERRLKDEARGSLAETEKPAGGIQSTVRNKPEPVGGAGDMASGQGIIGLSKMHRVPVFEKHKLRNATGFGNKGEPPVHIPSSLSVRYSD